MSVEAADEEIVDAEIVEDGMLVGVALWLSTRC